MKIKNQAYLAAGSVLLVLASQSNAALEEVVVTATKRAETIQDVPVSVTAVSADMMAKVGIGDMEDLSAVVPNFEINMAAGRRIMATHLSNGAGARGRDAPSNRCKVIFTVEKKVGKCIINCTAYRNNEVYAGS